MWIFGKGCTSKVSPNFRVSEFACKHCGLCHLEPSLVCGLELLREQAGDKVILTSGYRCPQPPIEGVNTTGQHTKGCAADIYVPGLDLKKLLYIATNVWMFEQGGIGFYPDLNIVHVDCRQGRARWGQIGEDYVSLENALQYWIEKQPSSNGQSA
jgi:uncharacterized protein YcbK (DUF882 family)